MRGRINIVAGAGARAAAAAGGISDGSRPTVIKPIPVYLGKNSATITANTPTPVTININQAVSGTALNAALFDDEFVSAPWRGHQTWQSGDKWSYCQNVGSNTNGFALAAGTTWLANPIVTISASTIYPAPANGALSLGLMSTPTGIGISQPFMGAMINNQFATNALRAFGYHEFRARIPAEVPGFLFRFAITDYPVSSSNTVEIDVDLWVGANSSVHNLWCHIPALPGTPATTIYQTQLIDLGNYHVCGVDWQPDHITFYLDGRPMGAIPTPANNDFQIARCYAYFLTTSAVAVGDISPTVGSLPALADIDYYRLYPNVPALSGVILVHAFNPGATAITLSDQVGQAWTQHPDARISSPPKLTAISVN
jgi:hypothetical protein